MKQKRSLLTQLGTLTFAAIIASIVILAYHVPFTGLSRSVAPSSVVTATPVRMIEQVTFKDSQVYPTNGTTKTVFTFSTRYTGSTQVMPIDARVVVDDHTSYFLICFSSNCTSNAYYSVEMFLPVGKHHFSFIFTTVDKMLWSDPYVPQWYNGPVVVKVK